MVMKSKLKDLNIMVVGVVITIAVTSACLGVLKELGI